MSETGQAGAGCANHPTRMPVGRCVRCKRPVCAECHTRLDGILHCRDCLGVEAEKLVKQRPPIYGRLAAALVALVLLVPALVAAEGVLHLYGVVGGRISRGFATAMQFAQGEDVE